MSAFGGKADKLQAGRKVCFMTQSGHERVAFAAMHRPDPLYSTPVTQWPDLNFAVAGFGQLASVIYRTELEL
jgi:hypothetical protein